MHELFTLHTFGLFLRGEAIAFGYTDRDLQRARRAGTLHRVRQGAYLPGPTWRGADARLQHRILCRAVLLTHRTRVALSHTSGAVEHGLQLFDPDLSRVHIIRLDDQKGRKAPDVIHHEGLWLPDDLARVSDAPTLSPELCALGAASLTNVEAGVCVLDSMLNLRLGTEESMWATYRRIIQWPFSRRLQVAVRLARKGAQSIGESRTRFMFFCQHLPEPVLQYEVYDDSGELIGITDFAWPDHGLLGEFDGRIKYGRLLNPDQQVSDVLFAEKQREDALREVTGFGMIRYTYGDLYVPERTAARTRRMLHRPRSA